MQESNNGNHTDSERSKPRGRVALDIWHRSISRDDEKRINFKISDIYKVDLEEAKEIHSNYHSNRILSFLLDWAKKHGMTESTFVTIQRDLDIHDLAHQVSMGELIEIAAAEVLYKQLCGNFKMDKNHTTEDRYINFYS
jgi:hypothetical protein